MSRTELEVFARVYQGSGPARKVPQLGQDRHKASPYKLSNPFH